MEMKNIKLGDTLMNVTSIDRYIQNPDLYVVGRTAIEIPERSAVVPLYKKSEFNPNRVGIYYQPDALMSRVVLPDGDLEEYDATKVIDLSDVSSMAELISKQEAVRDIEFDMLTTVDNKFTPRIGENDSPAMRALKTAVIDKEIDINKYSDRFGPNFNNDKRQYNKDSISIQMLERQCRGLDIKATLILEDVSPDVPNPIGHKVVVELTEGGVNDD